jgi:hypothetical protein
VQGLTPEEITESLIAIAFVFFKLKIESRLMWDRALLASTGMGIHRNVQNFGIFGPISINFLLVQNESIYVYIFHIVVIVSVVFFN